RREVRDRREEPEEVPQAGMEGPSGSRVVLVRAGLDNLHVVGREEVPEELATSVRREEEVQILVRTAGRLDQSVQFREDPLVRGGELAGLGPLEGGDEARDVPQLRDELARTADLRLADPEVVARVRLARHEDADRIRPVLLDQWPRIDDVPLGAMHRPTAGVESEAMDEDAMEGLRPPHEPGLERRVVEPGPDDLAALGPEGHGKIALGKLCIGSVLRQIQIRAARVHPGVEHAILADEFLRTAPRTVREGGLVLPWSVVLPRRRREGLPAFLAIPQRDLGVVEAPSGDRPVDRQAIDPVEEELAVPGRPELHLMRGALQVLAELEL